jgi:NADH dehydrogenase (ubiquinone) Fe-S protein 6
LIQSDYGLFRSDSEAQIAKVAVIEVKGNTAICDGGGGALGHPIEYIQLNTVKNEPQVCKYCGLRFIKAAGHHGHH